MQVFSLTLVLIIISLSFVLCNQEDEVLPDIDFLSIDRSNYVDPHDMLNYDRRKEPQDETVVVKTDLDQIVVQSDLENLSFIEEESEVSEPVIVSVKASKLSQERPTDINPTGNCINNMSMEREKPFLGRFVTILSRMLQLKEKHIEDGDVLYIPLLAAITKRTQFVFNEIVKEGGEIQLKNLADLDEVLSNLFLVDAKQDNNDVTFMETILRKDIFNTKGWLVAMFIVSCWMVLWMTCKGYSYTIIMSRSLILFFIVSWFWHWNYMDQLASAKRQADQMKNTDLPLACNPEQLGKWGYIELWISTTVMRNPNPCDEYHKVYYTDPTYEVNPLVALLDLLVKMVFQPMGYIGEKMGSFFDGVLTSAGLFYKIPVLASVVVVLFFILVMSFRYEIQLPFFKISPSVLPVLPRDRPESLLKESLRSSKRKKTLTFEPTRSKVEAIEQRSQDSNEDDEEIPISPTIIEELSGSGAAFCPQPLVSETNTSLVILNAPEESEKTSVEKSV